MSHPGRSTRRRRSPGIIGVVAMLAPALVACGIPPDSAPRDVPVEDRSLTPVGDPALESADGASRMYLLAPGEPRLLRSVRREAATLQSLVETLIAGPTEGESALQLTSAVPGDLRVRSTRQVGAVLYLDLSGELAELSGEGLTLAVAQVVVTADDVDGIDTVQITVDGERFPLPRADGTTTTGLLRVYDYWRLIASAQPPYPALARAG